MENEKCLCFRGQLHSPFRREACRGTLTDDNAAMADSDKHNV